MLTLPALPILLMLLPDSGAAPLRLCTDRGGLIGEQDDGRIPATLDGWIRVSGTAEALALHGRRGSWSTPEEVLLWEGPLAALSPTPPPPLAVSPADAGLLDSLTENHILPGCGHSGPDAHFVGAWPEPLPLPDGGRVTWASADQSLLRTPRGSGWMATMAMSRAQAAGLAAELAAAHPTRHTAVAWSDGVALIQVVGDPALLRAGLDPVPADLSLLPLIPISPVVLRDVPLPGSDGLPVLDAGRELAAWLNDRRIDAGLEPLTWDDRLAMAALNHCAYIDWQREQDGSFHAHGQLPGGPFFAGERPADRHGAWEVIHRDRDSPPSGGIDTWLATPFHRIGPMHPLARTVGACHSPDGTLVLLTNTERAAAPPAVTYPASGARDVPLSFSGLESPDPLPITEYPDKTLPLGFTVTAWLSGLSGPPRVVSSRMTADGQDIAHYPVLRADHYSDGETTVHLIPAAPLPPGAEVRWQVRLRSARQRVVVRGDFTTTDRSDAAPVAVDGRLETLLADLNAARVEQGHAPLASTALSQGVAGLFTATGRWPVLMDYRAASVSCVRPERLSAADIMLDPEFDLIGSSEDVDGSLCVALLSDPLAPR
jgi:hypothetical protein